MRRCLTTLVILALAFPIWGVPGSAMAASEINQQSTTEESRPVEDCQISDVAREAIENAQAASMPPMVFVPEAQDLLLQAERAAKPPECDSVRAKILADKAKRLSDATPEPPKFTITSETSETLNNDQPIFSLYDGPWEIGYGLDLIYQDNFGADDSDHRGLFVGKEISQTDNWKIGIQSHIISSPNKTIGINDLKFDGYSIFASARHRDIPFLQFKAGLVDAKYENINGRESGSGLAYGVAIVTGNEKVRIHWLDYEVYKIGDDEFKSWSVSVVVVFGLALGFVYVMSGGR